MKEGIDYIGIATPFYCNDGSGRFLFQKRNGTWSPGSGHLDFGLTPEENVVKEIEEEYGCQGEIQEQLPIHFALYLQEGKKRHWLSIPFFVRVDPREAKNNEPGEIEEVGWFSLDALPEPLHAGFKITFAKYRSQFEKYSQKK